MRTRIIWTTIALACGIATASHESMAVTPAPLTKAAINPDFDDMTAYAVLLGRAEGCGVNTEATMGQVTSWVAQQFADKPTEDGPVMPQFIESVNYFKQEQLAGKSPVSCAEIKNDFAEMQWP